MLNPHKSTHVATIDWSLQGSDFTYPAYSRDHHWQFGEHRVAASAAGEFLGDDERVDPEQAFVAAVSSCHMLSFLAIASRRRIVVTSYTDRAVGFLQPNSSDRLAITQVDLHPTLTFADGHEPSAEQLAKLHHRAHDECFIANSVNTEIRVVNIATKSDKK